MKTVTYSTILNLAVEMAGRTRDKLPPSEALIVQSALALDLEDVWTKQVWPDLTPDPAATAVTNQTFSKNEGLSGEIGDVICVLSANPRVTTRYHHVGFEERDNAVWIDEPLAQVWVEAMLPMPDLASVAAADLPNLTIPRRFRSYLSFRGAGHLLNADVLGSGNGALALAETALQHQVMRLPSPPEWRQVRLRTGFGRRRQPLGALTP